MHDDAVRKAIPDKANLKIQRAWFTWRIVVRIYERGGEECSINLLEELHTQLRNIWPWYLDFMFLRRVRHLEAHGWVIDKAVIDGNTKLARAVCARSVAELLYCPVLCRYTATQCSEKACYKRRVCTKHATRVEGAEAGPPQNEVIASHRRHRVLETAAVAEPSDVCLVVRGEQNDPRAQRRWMPAGWATPGQLQEY